jgi:steroid delta-isomerase-like uncharacterized protein
MLRFSSCSRRYAGPMSVLLLTTASIAVTGCATQRSSGAMEPPGQAKMLQSYNAFKDAWNMRDPAAVASFFHENGTYMSPAVGEPVSGPAFTAYLQSLFTGAPDFRVEGVSVGQLDDNRLADQWVASGTWTQPFTHGPLAGLPPTGKSFRFPGSGFLTYKDGKLESVVHYFDNLAFLTQIGVVPSK